MGYSILLWLSHENGFACPLCIALAGALQLRVAD